MTTIVIRLPTHPITCKMGSSISATMRRLKLASKTITSLPIIASKKKTNIEKCIHWCIQIIEAGLPGNRKKLTIER